MSLAVALPLGSWQSQQHLPRDHTWGNSQNRLCPPPPGHTSYLHASLITASTILLFLAVHTFTCGVLRGPPRCLLCCQHPCFLATLLPGVLGSCPLPIRFFPHLFSGKRPFGQYGQRQQLIYNVVKHIFKKNLLSASTTSDMQMIPL